MVSVSRLEFFQAFKRIFTEHWQLQYESRNNVQRQPRKPPPFWVTIDATVGSTHAHTSNKIAHGNVDDTPSDGCKTGNYVRLTASFAATDHLLNALWQRRRYTMNELPISSKFQSLISTARGIHECQHQDEVTVHSLEMKNVKYDCIWHMAECHLHAVCIIILTFYFASLLS